MINLYLMSGCSCDEDLTVFINTHSVSTGEKGFLWHYILHGTVLKYFLKIFCLFFTLNVAFITNENKVKLKKILIRLKRVYVLMCLQSHDFDDTKFTWRAGSEKQNGCVQIPSVCAT